MSASTVPERPATTTERPARNRVLLTAYGSIGDLHPHLALALGLRERGHAPVIGTSELYRERVTSLGIDSRPIRFAPGPTSPAISPELMARLMDSSSGT